MPGLPGVTATWWSRDSTYCKACSRPPSPTMQTLTSESHELFATRPQPDQVDGDARLLAQEEDEVLGRGRQLVQLGGRGDVGIPPRHLFVDRLRLVERGLVVRQVEV